MSLDISKLENVRVRNGRITARCPACAESGRDRRGNHLFVIENGPFACVVYRGNAPDAKAHRKRIQALCGNRVVNPLTVRSVQGRTERPIKTGLLGRLGRVFGSNARKANATDGRNAERIGEQNESRGSVLGVLKPYRPLTDYEKEVLRRKGLENDPLIIEALNIFQGRIVG